MRPPPKQTLSEWADQNRMLSPEASAEQGKWNTSRAEYQRGIMDAMTDPAVHTVSVRKPSQVGATEMFNNVVGYFIDCDPASMLIIQPTVKMAETWSKKRLTPMLRDTPCLKGKIKEAKSRDSDNTILEKGYPGGYMAIVGANTPNDLASRPMRVVIADEVDKYPASAGDFGDPLALAASRQTTYWNRKTLIGSTPGEKDTSTIERKFLEGDQRYFYMPCPHCGHEQVLRWEQVSWDKGDDGHRPETARYMCEAADCGALWSDAERWRAIRRGRWVATAPFNGHASFAISGFLSPWLTLEEIVRKFLAAKDYLPAIRQWQNEVKGEAWEDRGEQHDPEDLESRREAYDAESLPAAVRVITAGVDTQDDRLEVTITGWGDGEEAWVIRHIVLTGSPGEAEVWADLDDGMLHSVFRTEDGRELKVRATCIDSGGHFGAQVHAFCRERKGRRIYATKGVPNDHRGSKPIWGHKLMRSKNRADRLWAVGVDTAKDDLAARLRIVPQADVPTPMAVHFPQDGLPVDYFKGLTAEHAVTEIRPKDGRKVRRWKPRGRDRYNEPLDCFILSNAAMQSLLLRLSKTPPRSHVPVTDADGEDDETDSEAAGAEPEKSAPPPQQTKRRPRRRGRWSAYS